MHTEFYMIYVEDDEDDLLLMEEIMRVQKEVNLVSVGDGQELLDFLEDQHDGLLPCLVVLDNNTPRMGGIETARKLKGDKRFQDLSLALLTSSPSRSDEDFCRSHNITIFTKPATYAEWETLSRNFLNQCRTTKKNV